MAHESSAMRLQGAFQRCFSVKCAWYSRRMNKELAAKLNLPRLEKGWVWLVGAGPGDPGLITALGLQALAQADVILYDALVDARLLALSGAEKMYAGKRAGGKRCTQDEITELRVKLVQDNNR